MGRKKKQELSFEELFEKIEQYIQEYKENKTIECIKKIRKVSRLITAKTVNPTLPPPTTKKP